MGSTPGAGSGWCPATVPGRAEHSAVARDAASPAAPTGAAIRGTTGAGWHARGPQPAADGPAACAVRGCWPIALPYAGGTGPQLGVREDGRHLCFGAFAAEDRMCEWCPGELRAGCIERSPRKAPREAKATEADLIQLERKLVGDA